jgi:predicted O-methyltransferase YrrM
MSYLESNIWKKVCEVDTKYKKKVTDPHQKVLGNFSYFEEKCKQLEEIAINNRPKRILEIGLNCGHSAAIMLASCPEAEFISLDIGDRDYIIETAEMFKLDYPKFKFYRGDSKVTLRYAMADFVGDIDLALIDGDHTYVSVMSDLSYVIPRICVNGLLLVDDVEIPEIAKAVNDSVGMNWKLENLIRAERYTKDRFSEAALFRRLM